MDHHFLFAQRFNCANQFRERRPVNTTSLEDVILKKLVYFKDGGSEKHLRDVAGILKVHAGAVEVDYLQHRIGALGVDAEWKLVQDRLTRS